MYESKCVHNAFSIYKTYKFIELNSKAVKVEEVIFSFYACWNYSSEWQNDFPKVTEQKCARQWLKLKTYNFPNYAISSQNSFSWHSYLSIGLHETWLLPMVNRLVPERAVNVPYCQLKILTILYQPWRNFLMTTQWFYVV